jgi:transposase-like protein
MYENGFGPGWATHKNRRWNPILHLVLEKKKGITNALALPIIKMLYIYLLCPHSEHQKNPFQSKQSKHFHQRNQFTQCEADFNKVKLPKVASNTIVPVGAGPNRVQFWF